MERVHPMLRVYRAAWRLAEPFAPRFLARRLKRGKEDAARLGERRGFAGLPRPPGPLVWMHGASVGEALALLPLVARVQALRIRVLVTTGTVTSAEVLAKRLPQGAVHQYIPLDAPSFMARFLDTWRPGLILLAESELWPNMLMAARQRGVPVALVNARVSARSFARWRYARGVIGALLGGVDMCLAQSAEDAARLTELGASRVNVCGNLKYDAPPLPADLLALANLRAAIGERPRWIAASTHSGEEEQIFSAHAALAADFPALLTIVAPRHPARAGAIAELAASRGLRLARRSRGEAVVPETQIYLCDTIGELGMLYRLDCPVFLGKSLAGSGGQNPIEAAQLGNGLLHGPAVSNFAEVYRLLGAAGGAVCVADAPALTEALRGLLADERARAGMGRLAQAAARAEAGAADAVMSALAPYFAAMQAGAAR